MSDKLNILTSNIIRFIAGERPTADKFNAMNQYYSRSIENICRAIGDIYGRSIDDPLSPKWNPHSSEAGRSLDVATLGRLIGPASNLNPKMFNGARSISNVVEYFNEAEIRDKKEINLNYGKGIIFVTLKKVLLSGEEILLNKIEVDVPWPTNIDCFKQDENNPSVIYLHPNFEISAPTLLGVFFGVNGNLVEGGINYFESGWNVIPDPNQNQKLSFLVGDFNGSQSIRTAAEATGYDYLIDLNNFKVTSQQSGAINLQISEIQSLSNEYNEGLDYELPSWYEEKFSDASGGTSIQELPEGLIYLKDLNSNEIYLTASYGYLDSKTLFVKDANLCEDHDFCLILTGTDITTSIDDLRNKMFNHRHDGSFGEPFIRIQDLVGKFITGEFGPSSIPGNEFPMYLHRKGYQQDTNIQNGNNAMLGDLFMANLAFNGVTVTNVEGQTNFESCAPIRFLDPRTYIQKALGIFTINNTDDRLDGHTNKTSIYTGHTLSLTQKYLSSVSAEVASFEQKQMHIISSEKTINAYNSLDYPQKEFSGRDCEVNTRYYSGGETEVYPMFNIVNSLSKETFKADRSVFSPKVKLTFQPSTIDLSEYTPTPMSNEETKLFNPDKKYHFSTPYSELEIEIFNGDEGDYSKTKTGTAHRSIGERRTIVHYLPYIENSFSFEYKKAKELSSADGFFDAGTWGTVTDVDEDPKDLIPTKAVNSYSDNAKQIITFNSNVKHKQIASENINPFKSDPTLSTADYALPLYRSSLHGGITDSTSYYFPDDNRPSYYPNSSQANYSCIDISAGLLKAMENADDCGISINDQSFDFGVNLIYGISFIDDDAVSFDETLSHSVYLPYLQSNWGVKVILKDSENRLEQGAGRYHVSWLKPFLRDTGLSEYNEDLDFGNAYDYKIINGKEYAYDDYLGLTEAKLRHFARLEAKVNLNRLFVTPAENDIGPVNAENVVNSKIYALLQSGDLKLEVSWIGKSDAHPGIQYDFVGIYSESLDDSNDIDVNFNLAFAHEGYPGTSPENKSAANCLISNTANVTSSYELTQNGKANTITNQIQSDWIGSNTQYLVFPRTYSDFLGEKQKWSFNTFQKNINDKNYYAGKFAMHVQVGGLDSPEFNSGYKIKEFIEFPNIILDFIETSNSSITLRDLNEDYIDTHYLVRNNTSEISSLIEEDGVTKVITINGLELLNTKLRTIDLSSLLKVFLFKESFIQKNYRFNFDNFNLKNWDILIYSDGEKEVLDDAWSTWKGSTGASDLSHWYSEDYFLDNALYPDLKGTFRLPYDPEMFYDTDIARKSVIYGVNFFFEVTEEMKNENLMLINIDLVPSFTLLDSAKSGLQ